MSNGCYDAGAKGYKVLRTIKKQTNKQTPHLDKQEFGWLNGVTVYF